MDNLKKFKVTSLGEVTFTDAPSAASIREDLQRMGCYESDTVIEEVDPANPETMSRSPMPPVKQPKAEVTYFTMPNGDKLKEENGVMYNLQWKFLHKAALIERLGCDDVKIPECNGGTGFDVLEWVELKPEEPVKDISDEQYEVEPEIKEIENAS